MRCLYALCLVFAVSGIASAAGSTARVTVLRGFGGVVYEVSPGPGVETAPGVGGCPLGFTYADKSQDGLFAATAAGGKCVTGALTGAKEGLQVTLAAAQSQDFGSGHGPTADAGVLSPDADYLRIDVCRNACGTPKAAGKPGWKLQIVADRDNAVLGTRNGYRVTTITSAYSAKATPCALRGQSVPNSHWCTTVTIPWDVLELPFSDQPAKLAVAVQVKTHGEPALVANEALITVLQRAVFRTAENGATRGLGLRDPADDHRTAYMTQYDQYSAQTQRPTASKDITFLPPPSVVGAPIVRTFTLSKPFVPPAPPSRYPPPNADIDAPLGENLLVSAAFAQSNSFVQGLQKAIGAGVKIIPDKTRPKYPCESCGVTFQTRNSDVFSVPKTSAVADLLPQGLNLDEGPLKVDTLPDLYGGAAIYGASDDGSTRVGILHANPTKGFSGGSTTDTALAVLRHVGGATLGAELTSVHHALPTGPAKASSGKLNTVALPQVDTFSVFATDSNPKSDDTHRISNDVVPILRFSHDASDHAINAFGGVQATRTGYSTNGNAVRLKVFGGYRSIGGAYHTLDGVQPAYPGVSGPLAAVDLAWQRAQSQAAKVELLGYLVNYASPVDHYSLQGAKGTVGVGKNVSAFYEWSRSRISAALAAVSQLGAQLGDTPYQTARAALVPGILRETYATRDQTVGLELHTKDTTLLKSALKVGYNFEHVAPKCSVFGAVIECNRPDGPTGSLNAELSFALPDLAIAGSYKPTFYQGARSTLQSERVYNAAVTVRVLKCSSLVLSASNDAGILGFSPDGGISSTFAMELDSQMRLGALLPTAIVGVANSFASDSASYSGVNPFTGIRETASIPFRTHSVSFYTALRLGNRSFRASTNAKCLPKASTPSR